MYAWSSPLFLIAAAFARTAAVRIASTVARRAPLAGTIFRGGLFAPRGKLRPQDFEQTICKRGRLEDRGEQQQGAARVFMLGRCKQSTAQFRVATKALGAGDQPQIQLVFVRTHVHAG